MGGVGDDLGGSAENASLMLLAAAVDNTRKNSMITVVMMRCRRLIAGSSSQNFKQLVVVADLRLVKVDGAGNDVRDEGEVEIYSNNHGAHLVDVRRAESIVRVI